MTGTLSRVHYHYTDNTLGMACERAPEAPAGFGGSPGQNKLMPGWRGLFAMLTGNLKKG